MQQTVLKCSYEVAKMTIPSGAGKDVIDKMFEFQLPDGARLHSVTQIKETAIIGAPNTYLLLIERANTFTVNTPDVPDLGGMN